MPEAKLLFGIASLVIFGLVAWVVVVLRGPRETWAREIAAPEAVPFEEPPLVGAEGESPASTTAGDEGEPPRDV